MPENQLRVVDESTGVVVLERFVNDPSKVTVGKVDEFGNVTVTIGVPDPEPSSTEEEPKKVARKPAAKSTAKSTAKAKK